jgi:DNA polymerase-1
LESPDLIKLAMIRVDAQLRATRLHARMLVQVHDELVFEVPRNECEQLSELVTHAMSTVAPDFQIPLVVHVATGKNWAEAK